MKKKLKRILSALLVTVMLVAFAPIGGIDLSVKSSAMDLSSYKVGDLIEFGSYPQSKVTDETLIDELDSRLTDDMWVSYGYYSGTGEWDDGEMTSSDFMKYADIIYNGNKYRAVMFSNFRSNCTGDKQSSYGSYQVANGYYTYNTYFFKFEPLTWRILDPSEGYVMCNSIIDSQTFQNIVYTNGEESYNSKSCEKFASDWKTSSLRRWLNEDFYNTAFTDTEKSEIGVSLLENKCIGESTYDGENTSDKIFPISYNDAMNSTYGLRPADVIYDKNFNELAQLIGTDYAKCQGLCVHNYEEGDYTGFSGWWLRSPDSVRSNSATFVDDDGNPYDDSRVNYINGIVPAFKFNPKYKVGDLIEFGSYPQSEVKDGDLIAKIEAAGASISWVDYNYYAGTGEFSDGNMKPIDGMMLYKDITYNGNKYRAVKINQYRPYYTGYTSSTSNSYQDDNGYYTGNVYYFKYEPLTWRVLDPSEGYVICNQIIDSQAYQNFIYYKGSEYYNSKGCANYASDWVTSSLRQWLNNSFYNTAFSIEEKSQIGTSHLENKSTYSSTYDSADTYDKIFPISYYDAINSAYEFNLSHDAYDTARQMKGTDYAKCQGLDVYNNSDSSYNGNSWWRLRSPGHSYRAAGVGYGGWADNYCSVSGTSNGAVPAFKFNPKSADIHTHTLKHITVPESCTVNGMEYDICTECGETFNEKVIPIGHKLNHVVVPSTCKVAGMEYDICSECGETFNEKTLPLAAHTWGEWTIVKEATTTAEGQEKRTCSVCNKVETRTIEKLKALIDEKTGVEIIYNDEYDSGTQIKVEEKFDGDSFQLVNSAYGEVRTSIFDIATYKNGTKIQPDGEITVRIPLPAGYSNKVFVCYVDSTNGKVTKIPCEVKDGYVIFKTNHFSEYAIVEQPANVKSVSVSDITLNYKKSATIKPTIKADEGAKYTVKYSSSNTKVATVDENGKVYAAKRGSATITCTVTDSNGNTVQDTCKVTVKYSFGQWLIKILLFGWIWY